MAAESPRNEQLTHTFNKMTSPQQVGDNRASTSLLPVAMRRFPLLPQLLLWLPLPLLGLAVFWSGLHGGFIFDDFGNLVSNPLWKADHLHDLLRPLSSGFASDLGRPLAMLSFGINYYFTGMDVFALKLTGLCFHLLNGMLVWRLCLQLFALAPAANARTQLGKFAAWMVATAWLLHPLQVSSALYVVQRMEVGAATFVLLALLAYLRARRDGGLHPGWLLVAAACVVLGLGFKETALLAPAYALLIEICALRFLRTNGKTSRVLVTTYLLGIALAIVAFLLKILPDAIQPDAYASRNFTLPQRLLTQLPALTTYLRQILLPLPQALKFYYDDYPISTSLLSPTTTLFAASLLTGLIALAVVLRKRYPLFALGIGWFFVGHVLTSNVIPLELVFEHRNYFALLGILIAAAQALAWLLSTWPSNLRRVLAVALLCVLAGLCTYQAWTWGDSLRLATTLAHRAPGSPRAGYEYGRALLIKSGYDPASPAFVAAQHELERDSRLPGASTLADQALIMMLSRSGQTVPEPYWQAFRQKLASQADSAENRITLSSLVQCKRSGQCKLDATELDASFRAALQRNPESADLHSMYALFAINVLGDSALATDMARQAVRLLPSEPQYKINLAKILAASRQAPDEVARLVTEVSAVNHNGHYDAELAEITKLEADARNAH